MEFSKELAKIESKVSKEVSTTSTVHAPAVSILPEHDTSVLSLIKQEEKELLDTKEMKELGRKFSEERVKSDLSAEASRIRAKNIQTAENEFENETRELRLKHNRELLKKQHQYDMQVLEQDAKHTQMLEKRRKLVEKYGYLYDCSPEKCVKCYDGKGNEYLVPKDFSYSPFVNKLRQFGRNVSKLDKPLLQTLKWFIIAGVVVGGIFLLKRLGILS